MGGKQSRACCRGHHRDYWKGKKEGESTHGGVEKGSPVLTVLGCAAGDAWNHRGHEGAKRKKASSRISRGKKGDLTLAHSEGAKDKKDAAHRRLSDRASDHHSGSMLKERKDPSRPAG